MASPARFATLWVPKTKESKEVVGRRVIALLKLLAITGVILDGVFHWLESGTWVGMFDFLLDDFFEVENENLEDAPYLYGMQATSIIAHLGFLLGLLALLLVPLRLKEGPIFGGIKQMTDLPLKGKKAWIGWGALIGVLALGIMVFVLSLKAAGTY